ncbi:MAG TPA: chemotaxis protein CheW [Leptolyngbyaceae cyanobacterium]
MTNKKFVLFGQDKSLFALDLMAVREVLVLHQQAITPVPNIVPFWLGLTNLRGEILAVGDFGRLLNVTPVHRDASESRILIVETPDPNDMRLSSMRMGLAVSFVEGVVPLNTEQIVSAVDVSEELAPFLRGLYDYQGRLLMILDIEAISLTNMVEMQAKRSLI